MCDCIICIAGIILLTDMKAWRNFEILGFGLQDVKSNEPDVQTKPTEIKPWRKAGIRRKNKTKEHSIPPIRLGLMLKPELLNPKLEI